MWNNYICLYLYESLHCFGVTQSCDYWSLFQFSLILLKWKQGSQSMVVLLFLIISYKEVKNISVLQVLKCVCKIWVSLSNYWYYLLLYLIMREIMYIIFPFSAIFCCICVEFIWIIIACQIISSLIVKCFYSVISLNLYIILFIVNPLIVYIILYAFLYLLNFDCFLV